MTDYSDFPVYDMPLAAWIRGRLYCAGIKSLQDLLNLSENELAGIKGIGGGAIVCIRSLLDEAGLSLMPPASAGQRSREGWVASVRSRASGEVTDG